MKTNISPKETYLLQRKSWGRVKTWNAFFYDALELGLGVF
jgi:hypothetical protein